MKFQREILTESILDEAFSLNHAHWKEIAHYQDIILNPDRETYLKLETLGLLRLFTSRIEEKLVGYAVFFVKANIHYKDSIQANQDILYLDPSLRKAMNGYRFIQFCDEQLKAEGIQVVYQHIKAAHNFGPMLERIGYELVDHIYARRLN